LLGCRWNAGQLLNHGLKSRFGLFILRVNVEDGLEPDGSKIEPP
jgi:hypothetical protein